MITEANLIEYDVAGDGGVIIITGCDSVEWGSYLGDY